MLHKKYLFLILLLFPASMSFAQSDKVDSLKLNWELYSLPNGMQVLLQQDTSRTDVAIEFWLKTGTSNEEVGKYGLAHFFEHDTPYGLSDNKDLRDELDANMNFSNAQVKKDYIRYFMQVQPKVLELGLHYVSDRLKADTASITEKSVEWHRKNVLREIDRQSTSPYWGAETGSMRAEGTFGVTHPYGHDGYGSRKNNENFTAQDIRAWYQNNAFASNVILFVIGNFKPDETKKLIKNYFSDIHQKESLTKPHLVTARHSSESATIEIDSENHTFIQTWAVPGWASEDDAALRLLSNILHHRLTNNKQLPISITDQTADVSFYRMAGEFLLYISYKNLDDSLFIKEYLHNHIQEIKAEGVTEKELSEAVAIEIKTIKAMIDKKQLGFIGSRTQLLGEELLFTENPGSYLKRLEKQQALTTTEVQQAAKKWLSTPPFQLMVKAKMNPNK